MRKLGALGMTLVIGGGLVAGAAPAQAQDPTIACGQLIRPICEAAARQVQHAIDEVNHAYNSAYVYYEYADATVRCVVFKECGP